MKVAFGLKVQVRPLIRGMHYICKSERKPDGSHFATYNQLLLRLLILIQCPPGAYRTFDGELSSTGRTWSSLKSRMPSGSEVERTFGGRKPAEQQRYQLCDVGG